MRLELAGSDGVLYVGPWEAPARGPVPHHGPDPTAMRALLGARSFRVVALDAGMSDPVEALRLLDRVAPRLPVVLLADPAGCHTLAMQTRCGRIRRVVAPGTPWWQIEEVLAAVMHEERQQVLSMQRLAASFGAAHRDRLRVLGAPATMTGHPAPPGLSPYEANRGPSAY